MTTDDTLATAAAFRSDAILVELGLPEATLDTLANDPTPLAAYIRTVTTRITNKQRALANSIDMKTDHLARMLHDLTTVPAAVLPRDAHLSLDTLVAEINTLVEHLDELIAVYLKQNGGDES